MGATLQITLTPDQARHLDLPAGATAYIEEYDLDAGINGWMGKAKITTNIGLAYLWPTSADALQAWKQQSEMHPFRPDGQPNRPLSAYTAEIILVMVL